MPAAVPRKSRRAEAISGTLPLHARRRISGHQHGPISVAEAAGAGPQQYLLRRRRQPVDLRLARRRCRQHPALREGFPGAKIIRLERNYRSTGISRAAAGLIAHNQGRLGKTLFTDGDKGEKPSVSGIWDRRRKPARSARRSSSCSAGPVARRDRHSRPRLVPDARIRGALHHPRPALRVIGGPRFYERAEIRDALAYLRSSRRPTTISPSSASSTCRSAASATPAFSSCTTMRGASASR